MPVSAAEAPFPSFTSRWHNTSYPSIDPKEESLRATGKTVFITGAGTGIGARTTLAFAEAGAAAIGILGRRKEKLEETKARVKEEYSQTKVFVYAADVTNITQTQSAFSAFAEATGKSIDVFVNNAAAGEVGPTIANSDIDWWMRMIDVNVKGSLITTQAFLRHAASDAVVINFASAASFLILGPGFSAYSVSKAATVALFRLLQVEKPEARVVSIQPGVVSSEMNEKSGFTPYDDGKLYNTSVTAVWHLKSSVLMCIIASLPANFCVWLASPEAHFVAGKYLFVNWDVDELKNMADDIASSAKLEMWIDGLEHKSSQLEQEDEA